MNGESNNRPSLRALAVLALACCAVTWACDSGAPTSNVDEPSAEDIVTALSDETAAAAIETALKTEFRDNFKTAAAGASGIDIYWLGESFAAGDIEFSGPEVADFGTETAELAMHYIDPSNSFTLDLWIYSPEEWGHRRDAFGGQPVSGTREAVSVGAVSGELITRSNESHPVSALIFEGRVGNSYIEAATGAVIPLTPTPNQPNPLIDRDTFLGVLARLRPYPD